MHYDEKVRSCMLAIFTIQLPTVMAPGRWTQSGGAAGKFVPGTAAQTLSPIVKTVY
jgi:hypothetical protein